MESEKQETLILPQARRMEHHQIIAGTGHGKTAALKYMIAEDLRKNCTVIVMDSQGDLINSILELDVHQDRVVLIDPTDVEYPLCLNLFDVGMERHSKLPQFERERHLNSVISLFDFVLGSLLGAELTQKQDVAFRFVMRLMLHIPNSTIHTLRELFSPGGYEKYEKYVSLLPNTAQAFFQNSFNAREFKETKEQVVRRIYGVLENTTLERMFSNPKSKINMYKEMNEGKLILINTSKELLKEEGSQLFGRFFIALISQAIQERASIPANMRKETYFYIDEAQEYFNKSMVNVLEQARKYRMGMIFAHQDIDQLGDFKRAVASLTSIKFAGGLSMADARVMAPDMKVEPEFLTNLPTLTFAVYVKGKTGYTFTFDPTHYDRLSKRLDISGLRARTREKYAVNDQVVDSADTYSPPKESKHRSQVQEVEPSDEL